MIDPTPAGATRAPRVSWHYLTLQEAHGSESADFRLRLAGNQAELLHQRGVVVQLPSFLHLSVHQAIDHQTVDRRLLSGRRNGAERTRVRSGARPAMRDLVALHHLI